MLIWRENRSAVSNLKAVSKGYALSVCVVVVGQFHATNKISLMSLKSEVLSCYRRTLLRCTQHLCLQNIIQPLELCRIDASIFLLALWTESKWNTINIPLYKNCNLLAEPFSSHCELCASLYLLALAIWFT